jgi:hypothetical protein
MRPEIRWTNLSLKEMSRRLAEQRTSAIKRVLRQLLKKLSFVKRKAHKTLTMCDLPNRDVPLQNVAKLKQEWLTPRATARSTTRSNTGSFHMPRVPAQASCLNPWNW